MTSLTTTELVGGKEVYRQIPVPNIPTFPVLSWASLFPLFSHKIPSLYQSRSILYFTAARYALLHALKEIDAKKNDEILIPAYHCEAMIHPVLDAGCIPIFYKIKENFSTDIEDLEKLITIKSKAIIAVNYFGFIQNIKDVRKICNNNNLTLIEDCAHSLFGSSNGITVGQTGDYTIGSTKKFFPVAQGGILTCNKDNLKTINHKKIDIKSEIRFIYNTIRKSIEYGRLWIFKPIIFIFEKLRFSPPQETSRITVKEFENMAHTHNEFSIHEATKQPTRLSILLEKALSHHHIFIKRRENYNFLVKKLQKIPHILIPIPKISSEEVPYMLPIIIENLKNIFPQIEESAIPFQRFGQFLWKDAQRCHVSQKFSRTMLQLPCHQALSEVELQGIVDKIAAITSQHSKS